MHLVNLQEQPSVLHHYLKEIRSVHTQNNRPRFRTNIRRIGEIMAYEISKTLTYRTDRVQTPLGIATAQTVTDPIVVGTILRAGLPFHQGFLNYLDDAENAFVSAYRKYKDTIKFDIFVEYIASPDLNGKTLILTDPMLATGGSMELAYGALLSKGTPAKLHIASIIASRPAIEYIEKHLPDNTTVWVGVIDPELNEHSYIVPGLGDAGDLAFGQKI